jgi:DNA gyrase/topoisomerase IV subunit B
MPNQKEIIALDIFDAVRLRPTMYLGQVSPVDDKLPIIQDNILQNVDKSWSPGFMHLIVEMLENAIDEGKRMKGKMPLIHVTVNLDTNEIIIKDTGGGFHKAASKHKKTKKSVIRTAYEELHAGSNFTDTDDNILGTNGVGSSIVNILSEKFKVYTVNKTHIVEAEWDDFKIQKETKTKYTKKIQTGTTVSFIPSRKVFPKYKWDIELIETYLSYKSFVISLDSNLKKLELKGDYIKDGKTLPININKDFIPKDHIRVDHKDYGSIFLWEGYPNSCSVSFVNGSQCTGIHQKIVNGWANDLFDYNLAHHFYETLIVLNVPSTLMRFADQNKTKFATSRLEIENRIKGAFFNPFIKKLKNSDISKAILTKVEDKLFDENIKIIRKEKKNAKRKISEKYSPPSKRKQRIFITEGLSAAGGVKQARDSETDGVYALKGKVKNTKQLRDLTTNAEILEIMSILDLEPGKDNPPKYEQIIISADEDPDGSHIASLIINFFWKWFPHIISTGKLYKLITPLVAADHNRGRKYFYTVDDFEKYRSKYKLSNINYLKGLGSLSVEDWEYVMNNKVLFQISEDKKSDKYLEMAFGASSDARKRWLAGEKVK